MNRMLHIAATTQIRYDTEGRAYYRRKLAAGKTRMQAMRCLKRRISDAVYRQRNFAGAECGSEIGTPETVGAYSDGRRSSRMPSRAAQTNNAIADMPAAQAPAARRSAMIRRRRGS